MSTVHLEGTVWGTLTHLPNGRRFTCYAQLFQQNRTGWSYLGRAYHTGPETWEVEKRTAPNQFEPLPGTVPTLQHCARLLMQEEETAE